MCVTHLPFVYPPGSRLRNAFIGNSTSIRPRDGCRDALTICDNPEHVVQSYSRPISPPLGRLMANALTALRLLLVAPFAFFMARGDVRSAVFALIVWAVALTTDFLDGPVARRRGTVTAWSGTFDHTTDFLFVTSGLFAGAYRGAFPWILPVLIIAAFAQYVIDSYWIHRQSQTAREQAWPLQRHALFCSAVHGHPDSAGRALPAARC